MVRLGVKRLGLVLRRRLVLGLWLGLELGLVQLGLDGLQCLHSGVVVSTA